MDASTQTAAPCTEVGTQTDQGLVDWCPCDEKIITDELTVMFAEAYYAKEAPLPEENYNNIIANGNKIMEDGTILTEDHIDALNHVKEVEEKGKNIICLPI